MKPDIKTVKRELQGVVQQRALATVQRSAIDEATRTVEIAWASEFAEGERWFGVEILDCSPKSIRLGRLTDGGCLLFNHNRDALIGVVESVQIGEDRICRAKVRFDTCAEAELRYQQVLNDVLRKVSVTYVVHDIVLEKEEEGHRTYRVTDWEPYELSFVTMAFDYKVGVGRSAGLELADPSTHPATVPAQPKGARAMEETEDKNKTTTQPAPSAEALDIKRRDALIELGVKYADYLTLDDVQKACREAGTVQQLQDLVISRMTTKHSDTRGAHIGMSGKEVAAYSVARAVKAMITGDWKEAGREREASEAASRQFGTGSKGILIPFDVMASRDFTVGTSSEAGNLVATQLRPDLFVDVLRNRLALGRLGVTMLFGLNSNVDMPRKLTGSALGYLTEIGGAAETQPSTGKVTLSPKRIGGYIEFSKQAVIQSALAIEPMLRQDILSEYQVNFENAAINGSGSGANPRGIRNTSGIGAVIGGTNGLALSWDHLVDLESACANVNAEPDSSAGYLINTKTRGKSKKTLKAAGLPFIWDNGSQPLNGYRAEVTNNVPSNLTKGTSNGVCSSAIFSSNWPMLVMATFGAVELLVDETTIAVNGMNRLILNGFVDVGCRRAADFSSMEDLLTT